MSDRVKAKPLSLGAYEGGEGTKKERAAGSRLLRRVIPRLASYANTAAIFTKALEQVGVTVSDDDDLPSLVERLKDDPRAGPIVALFLDGESARVELRERDDVRRKTAAKNAGRSRKRDVTPEQVRTFEAEFIAKYRTDRGVITAGAAHFGIDVRRFSKLRRTLD